MVTPPTKKKKLPFNIYFSIFLPLEFAQAIAAQVAVFGPPHGLTGKPLLPHRIHVTLHDLGNVDEVPPDLLKLALAAGDAVAATAFDVTYDHAMRFPSSGTYVLAGDASGTAELVAFRESLGAAMQVQGLKVRKSYSPHMTVAYDRGTITKHAIDPVVWTAQEFILIKSHVGKGLYDVLGRWPLRA